MEAILTLIKHLSKLLLLLGVAYRAIVAVINSLRLALDPEFRTEALAVSDIP